MLAPIDPAPSCGTGRIVYRVDDTMDVVVSGTTATVPPLTDGIHQFRYHATDKAGNEEDLSAIQIKVDHTKPAVTYTANQGTY